MKFDIAMSFKENRSNVFSSKACKDSNLSCSKEHFKSFNLEESNKTKINLAANMNMKILENKIYSQHFSKCTILLSRSLKTFDPNKKIFVL